ncbi:Uncharacterised protein [Mycobacteroides abscessus]|uniref:Putative toxin-antitoxin system, antitoxin component, Xre domain protein n=1 Tax=Mycobacteroides abscessus subsp. massiliense TaxID=1962118 RepID=A0A1T8H2C6_9MYCO|nr:helix-turn-helix transcriptional regulator [Mycobacteroides abscessus]MBE5514413.1 hypothetical protein [Mycobacteroides abscessus]MDM3923776.1 helix-turn-helix transcriptional regulator [Mycobacteroides abscessus]MDO3261386.1 helix-turn-helix transcriptional regulator [Mycobacteroides abscessus subsp. abscessus]CPT76872.1 Uncharacterised protein [Mycobacteroides abscessus]CPU47983.1 Uncharacterised protein [Mycobacteroides abscessus]
MSLSQTSHRAAAEVRAEMARQGCTQAALAERINRDQHFISRRLSGKVSFTVDELACVAEALNVTIGALLVDPAEASKATAS